MCDCKDLTFKLYNLTRVPKQLLVKIDFYSVLLNMFKDVFLLRVI